MDKILSLIKQGKMNPALALIKENLSKCHIKDSKYIKSVFIKNYCEGKRRKKCLRTNKRCKWDDVKKCHCALNN